MTGPPARRRGSVDYIHSSTPFIRSHVHMRVGSRNVFVSWYETLMLPLRLDPAKPLASN